MPKLEEPEKIDRSPIPAGEYTVTLTAIKPHEGPNTFEPPVLNEETGAMEHSIRREWIWQFEAETLDPKTRRPYEYAVWTPRFYNPTSDKNKLTLLLRMLAPDASPDEHRALIEDDALIGRRWKVRITIGTSKNGKQYPTHLYFIPLEDAKNFDPDEIPV